MRHLRRAESPQCPAYEPPFFIGTNDTPGLYVGIRSRSDFDYARFLVRAEFLDGDETYWHPSGWCEVPLVAQYVSYVSTTHR